MSNAITELKPQHREIVRNFVEKLQHIERRNGGKTHILTVQINPDGTAVFFHGVPAGVIAPPKA